VDRLFLDANVLYSAAESPTSRFQVFWNMNDVELITSVYTLREARRNLDSDALRDRLADLAEGLTVVENPPADFSFTTSLELPEKDRPILLAAIHARATHLLTGDKKHFGRYYGQTIEGVLILPPAEYLRTRSGSWGKVIVLLGSKQNLRTTYASTTENLETLLLSWKETEFSLC